MKIHIKTQFDCTTTGVVGRYREERGAFQDKSGSWIRSIQDWEQARNQQRNYETLIQILSLRTQLVDTQPSQKLDDFWFFEVTSDRDDVFGNEFHALLDDCANVPMITGLLEKGQLDSHLVAQGPNTNIWFQEKE